MIRPEALAFLKGWAESALVLLVTGFALWVVGAPNLSFRWASLALGLPILLIGAVWLRAAIRRAMRPRGNDEYGRLFVEERRVLHIGPLSNTQFSLDDTIRIDMAITKEGERALLFHQTEGPPFSISLRADGSTALLDALNGLPGFREDKLSGSRSTPLQAGGLTKIWTRP